MAAGYPKQSRKLLKGAASRRAELGIHDLLCFLAVLAVNYARSEALCDLSWV